MSYPNGTTKVKLLGGPLDGREWDVVVSLPAALDIRTSGPDDPTGYHGIFPDGMVHPEPEGAPCYRYDLVHIETAEAILPAEAHYQFAGA